MSETVMTKKEREAFLAGLHVGILSVPEDGRGPLTVPVWYAYDPGGEVRFTTERSSRKGKLLARGKRVSVVVQTETAPYKYVSIEGPVTLVEAADLERDVRPLAHRYLGKEIGDSYIESFRGMYERGQTILVKIRPERWLTVDYAKL
jgi:PPOX class probable F420-dependent enzyme